ncbi:glycosyltransferase family 4 protein [Halobellus rubicundus]|uniref:Glycosyltransferase family 4 protein n=1 Tax=Halobellus rubicundus TaxID=2996466 RepID=A0ABD5MGQ3_9EURY
MARVAVLHNTLDLQGGADVVCLSTCAALQDDHDVTLYTLSTTDPAALAERFDIGLDPAGLSVRSPRGGSTAARALSAATPVFGPQLPFRTVLVRAIFEREADRYDLAVSTANEVSLSLPSVQYVHYPQFRGHRSGEADGDGDAGRLNRLWSRLAAPTDGDLKSTTLLANSAWTAGVVERRYGVEPTVVHPPVAPIEGGRPWQERENGIVVVGRLAPDKRILDAVEIVDGLRDRGHDVHLHVVGAAPPAYRQYVRRVESAAGERSYVAVETDVPRSRIEELLRTHRYGLNCKPDEHFGLSVAEYVAGGMIAFAPDGGGQRDVLDGRDDRLFAGTSEAIDLVSAAIEEGHRPRLATDRFAPERFRDALGSAVERALH